MQDWQPYPVDPYSCYMCDHTYIHTPIRTTQPGALNVKTGEKLARTILAASTAYQESRLGTTSGKGYYSPNVRVDGLGVTCSPLGLLPGAASTKGCWTFFLKKRLDYVLYETTTGASDLLPGTKRRNHPTSRPPIKSTGVEIELTKRTVPS